MGCGLPPLQVNSHAKAQVMARRGLEKQLARASCSASLISLLQQDADPMTLPVEERLYALAKAREVRVRCCMNARGLNKSALYVRMLGCW